MNGLSRTELAELVGKLPRYPLGTFPTPLHPLARLSRCIGGPSIWIKRDDLTGLAFGGNKVRQLEYFVGAAVEQGADVLIGGGGYAQSNHARVCSAAARAAGLRPVIVVRPAGETETEADANNQGNALLTRLFCDDVRVAPELGAAPTDRLGEVQARRSVFEAIAEEYRRRGHRPYVIFGTSVALGVIGYVTAAIELQEQFDWLGLSPDWVVVTSLGVTQAGLELASRLLGLSWKVCGMAYRPASGTGKEIVSRLTNDAAQLLGVDLSVKPEEIANFEDDAGPEYGVSSPGSLRTIHMLAEQEALILDPVYTAKGMTGLLNAIERGFFRPGETVIFVHTGGQPSLFAYERAL